MAPANVAAIADLLSGPISRGSRFFPSNWRASNAPAVQVDANKRNETCHGKRTETSEWQTCADVKKSSATPVHDNATNLSRHASQNAPAAYNAEITETLCGSPSMRTPKMKRKARLAPATAHAASKYENASRGFCARRNHS